MQINYRKSIGAGEEGKVYRYAPASALKTNVVKIAHGNSEAHARKFAKIFFTTLIAHELFPKETILPRALITKKGKNPELHSVFVRGKKIWKALEDFDITDDGEFFRQSAVAESTVEGLSTRLKKAGIMVHDHPKNFILSNGHLVATDIPEIQPLGLRNYLETARITEQSKRKILHWLKKFEQADALSGRV